MHVMEFSKGNSAALALNLATDSVEAFSQELRQVKAAILDWKRKHRDRCAMVMLTVVTATANHDGVQRLLDQVYREEAELAPLLHTLELKVALLNERGKPVKEYSLTQPAIAQTRSKPWWKFW